MADSLARGEAGEVSGASDSDLKARLTLAEERLDFYASFDRLIQDNVSQASRLMRDALDLRERTQAELDSAKVQAEERFAAERTYYRLDLEAVHADLVALQATAATMARRIAATIGAINSSEDLIAGGARPSLSTAITAAAVASSTGTILPVEDGAAVGEADEAEAAAVALSIETSKISSSINGAEDVAEVHQVIEAEVAALGAGDQVDTPGGTPHAAVEAAEPVAEGPPEDSSANGNAGFRAGAVESEPDRPEPIGAAATVAGGPVEEVVAASARLAAEPAPAIVADSLLAAKPDEAPQHLEVEDIEGARSVTVLVHGVPRAAAALALQRHLHSLSHVESVEAREYAEGVLRLHVVADKRLSLGDLQGWDGGAGLEPITVSRDVLEVRLPGAQGF